MNWKSAGVVGIVLSLVSVGCGNDGEASPSGDVGAGGAGGASVGSGGDGGTLGPLGGGGAGGEAGSGGQPVCPQFAAEVTDHAFGTGQSDGQDQFPDPVLGPPRGAGCCSGSLDVVSLGSGGWVELAFGETVIVDGPGPDFIVFENAFFIGGNESFPYFELATVEVSADGETWVGFVCEATEAPYDGCAGWHPVFANAAENDISPVDPDVSGGDAFDLADVGMAEARFVRITDREDVGGQVRVFDLDAVSVVNGECRAP